MIDLWLLLIIAGFTVGVVAFFIWIVSSKPRKISDPKLQSAVIKKTESDIDHIFDDKFREELRNRGRIHFEEIINENAMFLQHDLQLTASQLNEYMQDSIKKVLKEEFDKYSSSIEGAKEVAVDAIEKTQQTLEEQRQALEVQLKEEVDSEKKRIITKFEQNMNQIINHYLLEAIGNEIDMGDQLDYIFRQLEDNKVAIIEDIRGNAEDSQ